MDSKKIKKRYYLLHIPTGNTVLGQNHTIAINTNISPYIYPYCSLIGVVEIKDTYKNRLGSVIGIDGYKRQDFKDRAAANDACRELCASTLRKNIPWWLHDSIPVLKREEFEIVELIE